jgi:hypothetical protein
MLGQIKDMAEAQHLVKAHGALSVGYADADVLVSANLHHSGLFL